MTEYDVVIVGASFAGLSVASQVEGKVLLIDPYDIGSLQISACGAPFDVIKMVGCEDSVLQISNKFALHVNHKRVDFDLKQPYCTFDFKKFCHSLNLQNNGDFLRAKAKKAKRSQDGLFVIDTSKGTVSSGILVDATGWRASIAESLKPGYVNMDMLSFGIETEVPYRCESFHFFYDPDFLKDGICWIFPAGEFSRVGIASYAGTRRLVGKLNSFLDRFHLTRRKVHGGMFCYCLKEPVVDGVFVVGCAQGQTLPLTGEGIRRCITTGIECGRIIRKILDGAISMEQGLSEYSRVALKSRRGFDLLLKAQEKFLTMSEKNIEMLAKFLSNRLVFRVAEKYYRGI